VELNSAGKTTLGFCAFLRRRRLNNRKWREREAYGV